MEISTLLVLCFVSVALADDFKLINGKEYKNGKEPISSQLFFYQSKSRHRIVTQSFANPLRKFRLIR